MKKMFPAIFKIFLTAFFLVGLYTVPAYPQKVVNLLQGNIFDVDTDKPVYTTIMFSSITGRKNQATTESANGSYQVVLNPGESYFISFKGYLLLNESNSISIPPASEYKELKKDFKIKKIAKGMAIIKFKAFEPKQSEIATSSKADFENLKNFLRANPAVNVRITISSSDSYFNSTKKKVEYTDKKGKVKTKSVTVTSKEQLVDLLNKRIAALKEFFREIQFPSAHIKFVQDFKAIPDAKKKTKDKKSHAKGAESAASGVTPNIAVSVERILDI